jgi:hypothetical protein
VSNLLRISRVSDRSTICVFTFRPLAFICLVVMLSGFLTSISAQDKPVDSQLRIVPAAGQNVSGDSSEIQAVAVVDAGQAQRLIHIVPFGKVGRAIQKGFAPAGAHLTYWGGPVISNIHIVAVFWGPNVNAVITGTPGIGQFFTDITTSRYYDLLSEYGTAGVTGAGTPATSSNQAIGHGLFDGKFTITPSICPGPTACTVSDAQVAAELTRQITAGNLPQPVSDIQGNVNSFYMIYFPPGVTIAIDSVTRSCVQFCAYHSNTPANLIPKLVPYGVEPDFAPPSACANGCGGNPAMFDNVTEVTSHEMSEAATDALVGSAAVFGPPLAWYDPDPAANPLAEIGDICIGQGATVPAGNTTYVVQREFSNLQNDCVDAPPVLKINAPGQAGPGSAFNANLTVQSSVNGSALAAYTGTVHFTSSDAGATLPADYTFVAGDGGTHTFSFTLSALGNQTITATDTSSSGFVGSATINVNTTPDMSISKTHSGNFNTGQPGSYAITASNVGGGPSSGTVTVVDTLPASLTATAISGTGWSCTLATLTCTRADALAGAGSSYPVITLSVTPGPTPGLVTNVATVSGGGETNTANDVANDLTAITQQGADLTPTILVLAPGLLVNQGTTGAQFIVSITNVGTATETGTMTVLATLPAGFAATAMTGGGWTCTVATLTCTKTGALGAGVVDSDITVTFNVPLNAPVGLSSVGATVSTTDNDVNPANNIVSNTINIVPVIFLSTTTPSEIVTAGQQTQFVVDVRAGSQTGVMTFSCSGLPLASTCSFNPPSLNGPSGTVFMNITTMARAAIFSGPHPENRNPWLWLGLLSLAAMARLAVKLRNQTSRRARLVPILVTCGLLIVGIFAGCGGGGSTPPPPPPVQGTPAGAYVVTFTAASPNGTATKTMNLVVN